MGTEQMEIEQLIFNILNSSSGWDLKDDDGNEIGECLFIHDKLELVQ